MEHYLIMGIVIGVIFGIVLGNVLPEYFTQVLVTEDEKAKWFEILPKLEGLPYCWGCQSPEKGFDCSGLVVYLYNQIGVDYFAYQGRLVRDVSADALFKYNVILEDPNHAQRGDLIFYDKDGDGIIDHVAIFDKIDENGNVWVWDAIDTIDGKSLYKVSHRIFYNIWEKKPFFGKPLKVVLK